MAYIEFNHVVKRYASDGVSICALEDANFSVQKGELAVIVGASGAGKTTALNILGGMDTVTSGDVIVDGEYINALVAYEAVDENGQIYEALDEDMKARLQCKLIEAIKK